MAKRALHSFKRINGVTTTQDGENIRQIGVAYPAEHGQPGHRCSGFCPQHEDKPKAKLKVNINQWRGSIRHDASGKLLPSGGPFWGVIITVPGEPHPFHYGQARDA